MKRSRIVQRTAALVLAAVWAGYAAANAVWSLDGLASAYSRSWGAAGKRDAVVRAADGRVLFQEAFQNAGGRFRQLLNRRTANGFSIVRGDDGQLLYTNFYPYEFYDYGEPALKMRRLDRAARASGASLLYLNCVDLFDEEHNAFGGLPANNMNPRSDAFLFALQGYGVEYLDARAVLRTSGLDPARYRYRTEPHWTTEACFRVFTGLVEALNRQGGGIDPDGFYTDPRQYVWTEYPQSYLGKLGKITGAPYGGRDDFTLIAPAYPTSFTVSYWEGDGRAPLRGDFGETLLDSRWMGGENPYEADWYCAYLTEVYPFRRIVNHGNAEGPKVLMVGDSFMLPVAAFLSAAVGELHLLSPYSLPYGMESLTGYLEENAFDHVVIGLHPGTLYRGGFAFLDGIPLPEAR